VISKQLPIPGDLDTDTALSSHRELIDLYSYQEATAISYKRLCYEPRGDVKDRASGLGQKAGSRDSASLSRSVGEQLSAPYELCT
jgi:hypothetical protein